VIVSIVAAQWTPFSEPPVVGKELTEEQKLLAAPAYEDLPRVQNDLNSVYCCRRQDAKTHKGPVRARFQQLFNSKMFPNVPMSTLHNQLKKEEGAVANLKLFQSGEKVGFPMIVILRAQHVLKAVSATNDSAQRALLSVQPAPLSGQCFTVWMVFLLSVQLVTV
jgi:hypothetical protein